MRISAEADVKCAISLLEPPIDRLGPLAVEASVPSQVHINGVAPDAGKFAGATDVRIEPQCIEQRPAPCEHSLCSAHDFTCCLKVCGLARGQGGIESFTNGRSIFLPFFIAPEFAHIR